MKNIELLSPAGDFERLVSAVKFGADAVYLGAKEFGMRASPLNFTESELHEAVKFAHENNVKVYLTLNILPRHEDIEHLPRLVSLAVDAGVDAVIVADIGVMAMIKRLAPQMELHVSTQNGVVNHLTATELYHMGASRVVLARELSFDEIAAIRKNTPPELVLEAFVHGAMCMSVSGRCVISDYIIGRDPNRGECAQPCRWAYHLVEQKRPNEYYPVYEEDGYSYILNAKDLCMIEHISKLAEVGIESFKIEGRAKSAYYGAIVTGAYYHAIKHFREHGADVPLPQWILDEVRAVSHRNYSTGFYFGKPSEGQHLDSGGYVRTSDIVAVVDSSQSGSVVCTVKNNFGVGEVLKITEPLSGEPLEFTVTEIVSNGEKLERAIHPQMTVELPLPFDRTFTEGSVLRRDKIEEGE